MRDPKPDSLPACVTDWLNSLVEGQNISIAYRWGAGDYRRLPEFASSIYCLVLGKTSDWSSKSSTGSLLRSVADCSSCGEIVALDSAARLAAGVCDRRMVVAAA